MSVCVYTHVCLREGEREREKGIFVQIMFLAEIIPMQRLLGGCRLLCVCEAQ